MIDRLIEPAFTILLFIGFKCFNFVIARWSKRYRRIGMALQFSLFYTMVYNLLFNDQAFMPRMGTVPIRGAGPKQRSSRNEGFGSRSRRSKNFTRGIWLVCRG